jgi:hypothetical protein
MSGPTDSQRAVSWACGTLQVLDVSFKAEGSGWVVPDADDDGYVLVCETVGQLCVATRAWQKRRRAERAAAAAAAVSS